MKVQIPILENLGSLSSDTAVHKRNCMELENKSPLKKRLPLNLNHQTHVFHVFDQLPLFCFPISTYFLAKMRRINSVENVRWKRDEIVKFQTPV